jgi:hypothetical protein
MKKIIFKPEFMKYEKFLIVDFDLDEPMMYGFISKVNSIMDGLLIE